MEKEYLMMEHKSQTDRRIDVGKLAKGGNKKQETWMDNMGKVRIRSVSLASKATHNDQNQLLHDAPGVLSVKRGGGTFDFTIAPQLNPALDGENVVIGKVLHGMDVVDKINKIPTSKEDLIGSKGGFSALGKGFDGRAKLAAVERPLQRISILQCQVEEKASISSFLKF
jgi:cyclophilin family peptidyl-prolyl cis-trans isomerase